MSLWRRRVSRRRVLAHYVVVAGESAGDVTMSGLMDFVSDSPVRGGHYVLLQARQEPSEASTPALAGDVWIPAERMVFLQVVGEDAR